jgi:hypothetical protein
MRNVNLLKQACYSAKLGRDFVRINRELLACGERLREYKRLQQL